MQRAIGNWVVFPPTCHAASDPGTTLGELAGALRSNLHSRLMDFLLPTVAYLDWAEQQVRC